MLDSSTSSIKQLLEIPLKDINTDKSQPRQSFDKDSLNELSKSIREHGILQPILLRKDGDKNIIVAGERRFKAAIQGKLETIPAIFTTGKPAEIALVENLLREDLTPLEEAKAMERLIIEQNYNNKEIAAFLGKGASTISETLSILKLPDSVLSDLSEGVKAPKRTLIKIASLKDAKKQAGAWRKYKNSDISRDDIEKKETDTTDGRSNPSKVLLRFTHSVFQSLDKLDAVTIKGEDREKVKEELEKLEKKVKETLVKLNG
ncbi:MAG: ParB/RepB/Spo0J family partition protein [Magnetococcales bacterium]|nr:ParB/RepB/Spo0J family partition protein [Magnetococcales bacterium]